jgi:hypothetical protein
MQKEEVFTDNAMSDLMNDNFLGEEVGSHDDGEEGPDLEDLLGDESPLRKQSPSSPQNEDEVDYSSEERSEVITVDDAIMELATQEDYNREREDDKVAQANGKNEAQSRIEYVERQAVQAMPEQPVLTQQKVMDLIMQQQIRSNNTSGRIVASTWATKKQGFADMLSGFQSPNGTSYRVTLDLASVIFVSVAAADANRTWLMAQNEAQQS